MPPGKNLDSSRSISPQHAFKSIMASQRKSTAHPVDQTREEFVPRITLSRADCIDTAVLPLSELIAYSGHTGYTRLNLVGRMVLDVRETTTEIDRLVREASQRHVSSGSSPPVGLAVWRHPVVTGSSPSRHGRVSPVVLQWMRPASSFHDIRRGQSRSLQLDLGRAVF